MQDIKEKLDHMSPLHKAKLDAKDEEKAEKELAKARVEVAHEVRLAREAEAAVDFHMNKAAEKAAQHERNHPQHGGASAANDSSLYSHTQNPSDHEYLTNAYSTGACEDDDDGSVHDPYGRDTNRLASLATDEMGYSATRPGSGLPRNNLL